MIFDVDVMAGGDADEGRAHFTRFADDGAGFDAIGFGFVGGGDCAGVFGRHWDDRDGFAA